LGGKQLTDEQHLQMMRSAFVRVCVNETLKDYGKRNDAVIEALHHALAYGYKAGIRFDPAEPEWPVVFIELAQGQVSWHITQHGQVWDGHTTEEKYKRLHEYLKNYL
jgi:hypothetical protein